MLELIYPQDRTTPVETASPATCVDRPGEPARLLSLLAGCEDVKVRWAPGGLLVVRHAHIDIPWHVAEHAAAFRPFLEALAGAYGAPRREGTPRFADMLAASARLQRALSDLHTALVQ